MQWTALSISSSADTMITGSAAVSGDGRAALLRQAGEWHRVDTATGQATTLDLSSRRIRIDPRAEWERGVDEASHLDRNLFWDRTMRGLDWRSIGARYEALARLAGSHEDEVYVLGELQGELSSSHMFVAGGSDDDDPPVRPTALLGVDFAPDAAAGRYRLARIYRGDPSRPQFRAPLGEPGLDVHEGDLLLAIDGEDLNLSDDPFGLLAGRSGKVRLTLSASSGGPRRDIVVDPVTSEVAVRQLDWITRNRERVAALSGGRVGYVYLGDFAEKGTEDFA